MTRKSTLPVKAWIRYPTNPAVDMTIESDCSERADTWRIGYLFGDDNPNIFKTVKGWWWNHKLQRGFLARPIAKDVSYKKNIKMAQY